MRRAAWQCRDWVYWIGPSSQILQRMRIWLMGTRCEEWFQTAGCVAHRTGDGTTKLLWLHRPIAGYAIVDDFIGRFCGIRHSGK